VAERHKCLTNDFGYDLNTKVEDIICTCNHKKGIKKILQTPNDSPPVICYPNCPRVLFVAARRQTRDSAQSVDDNIVKTYHMHCDEYFEKYIRAILDNFDYDVDEWMTHITTLDKQIEVLEYYTDFMNGIKNRPHWDNNDYTLFAKTEKQIVEILSNSKKKYPKCRAISACPPNVKWIMGPVIYALEKAFETHNGYKIPTYDNDLKGTGTAKTWAEQEKTYKLFHDKGLTNCIDIDGSAWDSTITWHMKYLLNKIYEYLVDNDKIHHVCPELFKKISTQRFRNLIVKTYINKRTLILLRLVIDSTTFSGSMDTTFGNTLINASVAYTVRKYLNLRWSQMPSANAGDDHSSFVSDQTLQDYPIVDTIKLVWSGLGLVPKHILIGDFSSITFCSTNVIPFQIDNETHFKIVRQVNKLFPLSHYSIKAMNLSAGQMKTYYNEMAIGNEFWDNNMPFYSLYSKAYRQMASRIDAAPLPIANVGKPKQRFGNYKVTPNTDYETTIKMQRKSPLQPSDHVVYNFLLNKYKITKEHLQDLEDNLLKNPIINNPLEAVSNE
jgi:hypothetical protein